MDSANAAAASANDSVDQTAKAVDGSVDSATSGLNDAKKQMDAEANRWTQ